MFPERCDRGAISYLEGERVSKNWGILTERTGEKFDCFINLMELEFRGASPCIPGRGVGMS